MPAILSPTDPRLAPFAAMRDRDLRRETGLCLAEGEHLVRRAFEAGLKVRSVLVVQHKADRVQAMIAQAGHPDVEVFTCTKQVHESALGFRLHQGIVAVVEPPAAWDGLAGLRRAVEQGEQQGRSTLLVCPEITNAENLGLLARVGAGLGVGAMVLGPRCADPWYRRAVRVSMGAVFKLPIVRLNGSDTESDRGGTSGNFSGVASGDDSRGDADLSAALHVLRDTLGYTLIATVIDPKATPLDQACPTPGHPPGRKPAILLGSEGHGLSPRVIAACDQQVRIPMHQEIDSLNVAVAAGIVLYHYAQAT